ncbi:MAG: hypothetical protein N2578_09260, partial [Bdellovibrionaceae bacterium]|nr:hypothetical protein [Pseudobdellovibrionaceae bacterium]
LVLTFWIYYEWRLWQRGLREINRITAIALPAAFHCWCFFYAETQIQVAIPLLGLHGVAYLFLVQLAQTRLEPQKSPRIILGALVLTLFFAGAWESWLEETVAFFDYSSPEVGSLELLANTLLAAPALWHYTVDGWIWKKSDPEFSTIIRPSTF